MDQKNIFALGFFDGVHLGHQALLKECVSLAKRQGCTTAAITFDRHPQSLYRKAPDLISTAADRDFLLRHYGMDSVVCLAVTETVMSTPWETFLNNLTEQGAAGFVCGDDFRFGYRGEGNSEKLKSYCAQRNLPCIIVPEQTVDGIRVSSTHIRNLLEALALFAPFYKYQREAHHTFEAKLRNASTLLRLGRASELALLSP